MELAGSSLGALIKDLCWQSPWQLLLPLTITFHLWACYTPLQSRHAINAIWRNHRLPSQDWRTWSARDLQWCPTPRTCSSLESRMSRGEEVSQLSCNKTTLLITVQFRKNPCPDNPKKVRQDHQRKPWWKNKNPRLRRPRKAPPRRLALWAQTHNPQRS